MKALLLLLISSIVCEEISQANTTYIAGNSRIFKIITDKPTDIIIHSNKQAIICRNETYCYFDNTNNDLLYYYFSDPVMAKLVPISQEYINITKIAAIGTLCILVIIMS